MKSREEIAAQRKAYREANCEKIKLQKQQDYLKRKDFIDAYNKEYASKHKSEKSEYDRKRRLLNIDTLKEYQKNYREINREKLNIQNKEYYEKNKEEILRKSKEYREKLGDVYYQKRRVAIRNWTGGYNITLTERHKDEYLNQEMILYKIQLQEEDDTIFYKYGLTTNLKGRFRKIPYKVVLLETIVTNKYDAIYLEIEKLKSVKKYNPQIPFKGYTECFC